MRRVGRLVATVQTSASVGFAVQRPARDALYAHLAAQLAGLPETTVVPDNEVAFAFSSIDMCKAQPEDELCWLAIAEKTAADMLVVLHLARLDKDACSLELRLLDPSAPASPPTWPRIPVACKMDEVREAANDLLRSQDATSRIAGSLPPPRRCEDVCQADEHACKEREALRCEDGNWDGCIEWVAYPCASTEACSSGKCIAGKPEMVFVPEGPLRMGLSDADSAQALRLCESRGLRCRQSWWRSEQPAHWVQISGFFIDTTEVTQAAFDACVQAGACRRIDYATCKTSQPKSSRWAPVTKFPAELRGPRRPAVCATFEDAAAYCAFVGKRLPTEAEWEKAARGTDNRLYPWGNAAFDGSQANACDERCRAIAGTGWPVVRDVDDGAPYVADVGSYPKGASPYGALDMAGNAWEWVSDWYDETFYSSSPREDPRGPESGEYRTLRGGSWSNESDSLRTSYRYSSPAGERISTVGFRCAYP